MEFSSIATHTPPKGTSKYIIPTAYTALDERGQYYYQPEYREYRVKKQRSYETCDLGCRHFTGWEEVEIPVGDPYRYIWTRPIIPFGLNAHLLDSINQSNVLAARILSDKKGY